MRPLLVLVSSVFVLWGSHSDAEVLTFDARNVSIVDIGESGIGLSGGKSAALLIHFEKSWEFYVKSALASALSLNTFIKIDTDKKRLDVGLDGQRVENGWLIDARNVHMEDGRVVFRKDDHRIVLDGLPESLYDHVGGAGYFVVRGTNQELKSEFIGFDSFIHKESDAHADGQPTLRIRGNEEREFRAVGKNLTFRIRPKSLHLSATDVLPTAIVRNGADARLYTLRESGIRIIDAEYPSWRLPTGAILLSPPNRNLNLASALERLKRNADNQGQVILIPMQLNGKWAILKVIKQTQTLYVDWSGSSSEEHLAEFLPLNDNNTRRVVQKLRPPKKGEDDSVPMFEKLEELSKEQVSPRDILSPRTPTELLQHAVAGAVGLGEDK